MSMDFELIFWIVAAVVGLVAFGVMMALARKEAETYVDWVEE